MDETAKHCRQSTRVSRASSCPSASIALNKLFCRYMPYVGYVTIALNDYPKLKYLLLGGLGLSLLLQRE